MRTATCLLVGVLALSAGEPAFDPATRAGSLAPLIEEETFALARVDLTRVDADGLLGSLSLALPSRKEEIDDIRPRVKTFQARFLHAGGRELVVSCSTADQPPVAFVHVPLRASANVAALTKLLDDTLAPWGTVEKRGNALFAGPRDVLARLAKATPAARPELLPAVSAAGDTAMQVLLLPTNDQRRVVEEVVTLPELGATGKTLTRGVRWAALGIDAGSKPRVKLTVQSADADAAKAIARTMVAAQDRLGKAKFPGQQKTLSELLPREYTTASKHFVPTVRNDVAVVETREPEAFQALAVVLSTLDQHGGVPERSPNGVKMKQILIALHSYHDTFGHLPANAIYSKEGKPLLSWRVAVLPYLDQGELYKEFKLDEPWDSEHNKKLVEKMPKVYRSPMTKDARKGRTTYLVPVHPECGFTGTSSSLRLADFKDGLSNTTVLVDASDEAGVIWSKPDDLVVDKKDPWKGLLGHYPTIALVAQADGSVWRIPKAVAADTLWKLFTRAGNEVIPDLSK